MGRVRVWASTLHAVRDVCGMYVVCAWYVRACECTRVCAERSIVSHPRFKAHAQSLVQSLGSAATQHKLELRLPLGGEQDFAQAMEALEEGGATPRVEQHERVFNQLHEQRDVLQIDQMLCERGTGRTPRWPLSRELPMG